MPGAGFDATSDERELERLAYSRPVDGVDPAAAQAQLAAIAESRKPQPEIEWTEPSLPATPTRREKMMVAVALVGALVVASAVAVAPVPSLTVFDVPQVGVPTWPGGEGGVIRRQGERADNSRWLASHNGWDVYAFITTGSNVCMASFDGTESAGGVCTSRAVFEIIGLQMGASRTVGDTTEYLSVRWGPSGGARISDLPLAQWKE